MHGLLQCLTCLLFLVHYVSSDNPTAILSPFNGSDPGYIIAECDTGLANRLRVLAAFMHVGRVRFNDAHLVFVWDVNSACPGE